MRLETVLNCVKRIKGVMRERASQDCRRLDMLRRVCDALDLQKVHTRLFEDLLRRCREVLSGTE